MSCWFNVRSKAGIGVRNQKIKSEKIKTDMLRSNGKQSGKSVESVLEKKRKGCGGKDLWKRKVLSLE